MTYSRYLASSCGAKGINHCVRKFPLCRLQKTLYYSLGGFRSRRNPPSEQDIEVFGEECGEEPFYKKVLPASYLSQRPQTGKAIKGMDEGRMNPAASALENSTSMAS